DGKSDGWVKLFNGKDLTGWRAFVDPKKQVEPDQVWSVKDGVLVCQGVPYGYVLTEKDYGDYVLRVQWRWGQEAAGKNRNGGGLRARGAPATDSVKGVVAPVVGGRADAVGAMDGAKPAVVPARLDPKVARHAFPLKDGVEKQIVKWNQYEITCDGHKIMLVV